MKRFVVLLLLMLSVVGVSAQKKEKIRGNKDVVVTQTQLEDFSVLEIGENFKVTLVKGNEAMIEIETDENLQDVFVKQVSNQTFTLRTNMDIRRSKKMRIRITFTENLQKVIATDNAVIEGLTSLYIDDIEIEARNNAVVNAGITSKTFKLKCNDKSKVELNLTTDNAVFQLNQSSNIKALVTATDFKVDLYESASARIEGDVENLVLRADNSSKFTGEKLAAKEAVIIAEGRSENTVNVKKDIDITATGTSKTSIYGNPKFTISSFSDEASLHKKK